MIGFSCRQVSNEGKTYMDSMIGFSCGQVSNEGKSNMDSMIGLSQFLEVQNTPWGCFIQTHLHYKTDQW